jgi:hypothetical protein
VLQQKLNRNRTVVGAAESRRCCSHVCFLCVPSPLPACLPACQRAMHFFGAKAKTPSRSVLSRFKGSRAQAGGITNRVKVGTKTAPAAQNDKFPNKNLHKHTHDTQA